MTQLLDQLRASGLVDERALESARRRQQIYGGSLDTVLLELELIDPYELEAQLCAANRCEAVPVAVLEPGPERPWDALPEDLAQLGWVMPLRRHNGMIQVAIHPEIPADQRAALERAVEHVEVLVTCEACLAKLAAERSASVIPQRYAILALRWIQAMRQRREQGEEPPKREAGAPAPWMSVASETAPFAVPPTDAPAPPSSPVLKNRPPAEPGQRSSTFLYGLPVADDDEDELPPLTDDDEDELPPLDAPASPRPPTSTSTSAAASAPPLGAAASAPISDALRERLAGPRSTLARATKRDQTTDALVRAAMVLSPRVALFGIKREGLRGLDSPGEITEAKDQLVEISPKVDAVIEGQASFDRVVDLDLRIAVGQEVAVPCIFLPIQVHERPVLMLYLDRDGEAFAPEEITAASDLCEVAGQTLELVLRNIREGGSAPSPVARPQTAPNTVKHAPIPDAPAPAPIPVSPTPAPIPVSPTPSSGPVASPPAFEPPRPRSGPTLTFGAPPPGTGPLFRPPSAPVGSPRAPSAPFTVASPEPPQSGPLPASAHASSGPSPIPSPPPLPSAAPPLPPAGVPSSAPPLPPAGVPSSAPGVPDSKPPVRVPQADSGASPRPKSRGVEALSPPLGAGKSDAGASMRGRIQLDDEDRPRRDDTKAEIDAAIQEAMRGSGSAIEHLLRLGDPAFRRIIKKFPGELDVARRDLDALPPLPAHGPLIRAVLDLGEVLGSYLLEIVDHPNPTVRFYVAFVFMELRFEAAVSALGELAFDPDADVRAIAMRVLETYSGEPGFDAAVAAIRRELDSPNRTRQLHSTRAVGTVRDIQAVAKLIDLLTSKERYIQEAALESLCSVTGQQLGLKPHRWRSWYGDNAHHHRVEWIISSLAHKDLSVRRWAADELRRITGQRINFLAAGSKQEREIGIRKWVEWWNADGRAQFGG
ncbi:hypothetical protein G6O69_19750 [Pseudenhygromyxa sp. WMMC2535]|uniref:hypothetical protein n=1 Tax=Pseudenhygromyxa sp. WMMC2535 TaxID=2712867 RepID=UPI001557256B|nr:hypothetical protein [Pseudenhygromyxa sp. WMMC2535]NVB40090.1 hypothetical protein [Pseudenhygromyxa sp. WMMC2535]